MAAYTHPRGPMTHPEHPEQPTQTTQPVDIRIHQEQQIRSVLSLQSTVLVCLVFGLLTAGITWAIASSHFGRELMGLESEIKILQDKKASIEKEMDRKINHTLAIVEHSNREVAFQECTSKNTKLLTNAAKHYSEYLQAVAFYDLCIAHKETEKSKNAAMGAMAGAALAAFTGGGSLVLTGAGMWAAQYIPTDGSCKKPPVKIDTDFIEAELTAAGITHIPTCTPAGPPPVFVD